MPTDDFEFRLDGKRTRIAEREILDSLRAFADNNNGRPITTMEYNQWKDRVCHSWTILDRLGTWRVALAPIGIATGVKALRWSPRELMDNLERVWRELERAPGRKLIGRYGLRISEPTYRRRWGSLQEACLLLARFKKGEITEEQLLGNAPSRKKQRRSALPLNVRWDVLKRDNYRCKICGARPPDVDLEVDHIVAVLRGGTDDIGNLRTLCLPCNQGKKAQ